ncbi:uncharacterized protein METZ01_LOCUS404047, partial [marine metagenome]
MLPLKVHKIFFLKKFITICPNSFETHPSHFNEKPGATK